MQVTTLNSKVGFERTSWSATDPTKYY